MAQASTAELIAAWRGMTEHDVLILRKMGRKLIEGTRFTESMDLMHEAFDRCLDGRRNWPTHVRFSVFLGNVMRSIASAERRREKLHESFEASSEEEPQAGYAPSAEQQAIVFEDVGLTMKAVDALRGKLAGDEAAQKVLGGMAAGMSPKEIRQALHMDSRAYEAARMRIARRMRLPQLH